MRFAFVLIAFASSFASLRAQPIASPGNRCTYLHDPSPFYAGPSLPRVTTPMWIGEENVDAAVILSIDDLTEARVDHYRDFLAPILARLDEIQGYSPLNIFTNRIDPSDPQVQRWIDQGVRLDVHTRTHPCPLMRHEIPAATSEVFDCLSNLNAVPNHFANAFRMPCTDSINSSTPLFFREILPQRTNDGRFLEVDSSVSMFPDSSYEAYAPFLNYAATISEYPYPYVVGGNIWELPIVVPTDWQAQHRRGVNHPQTVAEVKRAFDIVIEAKGLYTWCFHPHGWIRNTQIIEVIDHVRSRYGARVKFLNIQETLERLTEHMLGGVALRDADGSDGGVRLVDIDGDGRMDVVVGNDARRETRVWHSESRTWRTVPFPFSIVRGQGSAKRATGVEFGVFRADGKISALLATKNGSTFAHFDGEQWTRQPALGLVVDGKQVVGRDDGRDRGLRLRDVDGDGYSDAIVNNDSQNLIFRWNPREREFERLASVLPALAAVVDAEGRDGGLRFWDVDRDGDDDLVLSNDREYFVYLYEDATKTWSTRVLHGSSGAPGALPKITSRGEDRGAWFKDTTLYVANTATAGRPNLVETRDFAQLLEHRATPPKSPEEARATLRVPDGFRVELVASEPLIADPVSVEFGADGRVWVAEMGSYPLGRGEEADGRIRVLRDTDGDGRLDQSTVFAHGLSFPAGALPFRGGVLVTCAPNIYYFEDRNGDDRADSREIIFSGFGEGNQQHRVNGLHYGIDNWIYGANGDSGGTIRSARAPDRPALHLGGRDFRFRKDLTTFEAATGRTQFGLAMDDFGRRYGTSNSRHILYAVLPDRYLGRNPHVAPPNAVLDIAEHGAMARIYPISKQLISLNSIHVPGHFSSACGISIYRGERFPPSYRGSAFVADPVANLVHRDVLVPDGASVVARRSENETDSEFLASTDAWFRPVYTTTGPDGALYVVDMHRYIIEHPEYIPEDLQQILDFAAGRDRGRIYRVVYASADPRSEVARIPVAPSLDAESDLAAALASPNGWIRDTAQRLIVEHRPAGIATALRSLARASERAATRIHALWTLDALGALDESILRASFSDPSADVREHAARLAESRIDAEPVFTDVVALTRDSAARVRVQVAFTLGASSHPLAGVALADLLRRHEQDPWLRAAVLSSSRTHAGGILAELAGSEDGPWTLETSGDRAVFNALVATVARESSDDALRHLLARLDPGDVRRGHFSLLGTLATAAGARLERIASANADVSAAIAGTRRAAREKAIDPSAALALRVEAVRALGGEAADLVVLEALVAPRTPSDLQIEALRLVKSASEDRRATAAEFLLARWDALGPRIRGETLELLVSTPSGADRIAAAIDAQRLDPRHVSSPLRSRLRASASPEVRARLARAFAPPRASSPEAHAEYRAQVRSLRGEAESGRAVFEEHCSNCHRLDGLGFDVGPRIEDAAVKGIESVLEAILAPAEFVPPRYTPYIVESSSGQVATGLIAEETATSVRLVRPGGVTETILRSDLESLTADEGSLMPSDLAAAISPQAMADLLAFVAQRPANLDALDPEATRAASAIVEANAHNGLAEVLEATEIADQASWVGRIRMSLARQLDGKHAVAWKTDVVPDSLESATYSFHLPVAMGYVSQPSGSFTLHVGERRVLEFNVTLESATWKSPGGAARLDYSVRARNSEDSTGILTVTVPIGWLEPGSPATLRVTGSSTGSRRWFGVLPLR